MICFPIAKINLGLSITERRSNGMHNLSTCMIPVPLYDVLEIRKSSSFSITTRGKSISVSADNNIITKTWELLSSIYKRIEPVDVYLYKNIPAGSGLGGGSADAAFFIKLVNDYYSLNIGAEKMRQIANEIGADCPFFIESNPVVAAGTGNIFTPINNPVSNMFVTIVFPGIHCSTKELFSDIVPKQSKMDYNILKGEIGLWKHTIVNDFEEVVFERFPELMDIKDVLYNAGADYVSMTGSGSGIFALSETPLDIDIKKSNYSIWSLFIE